MDKHVTLKLTRLEAEALYKAAFHGKNIAFCGGKRKSAADRATWKLYLQLSPIQGEK